MIENYNLINKNTKIIVICKRLKRYFYFLICNWEEQFQKLLILLNLKFDSKEKNLSLDTANVYNLSFYRFYHMRPTLYTLKILIKVVGYNNNLLNVLEFFPNPKQVISLSKKKKLILGFYSLFLCFSFYFN